MGNIPDKFEIFSRLLILEGQCNHSHIYISVGQMVDIMHKVSRIHANWNSDIGDSNYSIELHRTQDAVYSTFDRSIVPLGDAGKNRM